jgi:DNA-binding NtrC family response regulator
MVMCSNSQLIFVIDTFVLTREQLSSMASESSRPGITTTDFLPCLPDLNPESDNSAETSISTGPTDRNSSPGDTSPTVGDLPPSSLEDKLPLRLLVVNENIEVRQAFCEVAASLGFLVDETGCTITARGILAQKQIDILLMNVSRPDSGAQTLFEAMKLLHPETLVIVMSASATIASAVDAMRIGACDYLSKPFPLYVLTASLERAAKRRYFDVEVRRLQETLPPKERMAEVLGKSTEMEKLYRILSNVADSRHPVMIIGEHGTGKQLLARSIHSSGPHAAKPFVSLDCKTLGHALLEIELFGHAKDALSGVKKEKRGLLASSLGGTLFLNEIGDISLDLQEKLIKALRGKEILPIGGTKAVPISVRILAATDRDLTGMVTEGRFRMDLYQVLSVVNLRIPPLRGRPGDIAFLAKRFLEKIQHQSGTKRTLSDETLRILEAYDWPENVRELEQSIVRACSESSGVELHAIDLPQTLLNFKRTADLGAKGALAPEKSGYAGTAVAEESIVSIAQVERRAILDALRQTNGDKLKTALLLGIGKTTLYRKLKEYGLVKARLSLSNSVLVRSTLAS